MQGRTIYKTNTTSDAPYDMPVKNFKELLEEAVQTAKNNKNNPPLLDIFRALWKVCQKCSFCLRIVNGDAIRYYQTDHTDHGWFTKRETCTEHFGGNLEWETETAVLIYPQQEFSQFWTVCNECVQKRRCQRCQINCTTPDRYVYAISGEICCHDCTNLYWKDDDDMDMICAERGDIRPTIEMIQDQTETNRCSICSSREQVITCGCLFSMCSEHWVDHVCFHYDDMIPLSKICFGTRVLHVPREFFLTWMAIIGPSESLKSIWDNPRIPTGVKNIYGLTKDYIGPHYFVPTVYKPKNTDC